METKNKKKKMKEKEFIIPYTKTIYGHFKGKAKNLKEAIEKCDTFEFDEFDCNQEIIYDMDKVEEYEN
jgi:hypothetical protein